VIKKTLEENVVSVLKRKHERDLMNEQIRNQHFPSKVSKFGYLENFIIHFEVYTFA